MIRVALVDDHALIRGGIKALIESMAGYQVVAEGSDGEEVADLLSRHRPDILLLDLSMKRVGGLDVLQRTCEVHPQLKVLILSMHTDEDNVLKTLRLGAQGYLLKDAAVMEMHLALKALVRGEQYLSPGIAQAVIRSAVKDCQRIEPLKDSPLTARQIEILRLISRGCSAREIAEGLGLSVKTVDTHRAQIMQRLEVRDVPSLVLYAIKAGLICLQD